MKLKKLLAAVTAAALAVSTMAVTNFTASAVDKPLSTGSYNSGTLEENAWDQGHMLNPQIMLQEKWGTPVSVSNYEAVEITYTCTHPENVENVYVVAQGGTMPNEWYDVAEPTAESGTVTLDFTSVKTKTYEALLVMIEPKDTYSIGDTFEAGFTVTSAKIIAEDVVLPANLSIAFDTDEIELVVKDNSAYGGAGSKVAQKQYDNVLPAGVTTNNTFGELKNSKVTLSGIQINNVALEDVDTGDVEVIMFALFGDSWTWAQSDPASGNSIEWDLSTITGVSDTDELRNFGYQININGSKIDALTIGDTVKVNSPEEPVPANLSLAFPTDEIELTVMDNSEYGAPGDKVAKKQYGNIFPTGVTPNKTYGDMKNSTVTLTGIEVNNVISSAGDDLSDGYVSIRIIAQFIVGEDNWSWSTSADWERGNSSSVSWDLSEIENIPDNCKIGNLGYEICVYGDKINALAIDDTVKVNSAAGTTPTGSITISKNDDGEFSFPNDVLALFENTKTQIVVEYDSPKGWNDIGFGFNGSSWISANLPAKVGHNTDTFTVTQIIETADVPSLAGVIFGKVEGYNGTEIISVTVIPGKADNDDDTDRAYALLWEGSQDLGNYSAMVTIAAEKFSPAKADDTIKFTYTFKDVPDEPWNQIKILANKEEDTVLESPTGRNEWNSVNLSSATAYSFVINAADLALVKEFGMKIVGHGVVLSKVELNPNKKPSDTPVTPGHTHTTATAWSNDATGHWHACSGCTDKVDFADHTSDNGTDTTPATATTAGTRTYKCTVCGYVIRTETIPATGSASVPQYPSYIVGAPVIPTSGVKNSNAPTINGKDGWDAVAAEITAASDGDVLIVDMNSATKVPSTVFKAIKDKDVDLVLNLNNGIKWTVNGLSVTSTKAIDFDVTKNTKHIPSEVVDKAEGSHKRQISLAHNGSFGCGAVMSYDVGTQYNGLYANLFYYNRKAKELELIYCSPISGGKASFLFTHASDYLITVSDEPLGDYEDVSSAAGIASDNSGVNSIAFCSVLAVITLAFGYVVYKKRRHN